MHEATALIVDDHQIVRDGIKLLLEHRCGLSRVHEAASYEEAVTAIENGVTPDLVTLDMRMPGLGGLEAFESMREALPQARFVIVSGIEDRNDVLAALGAGAHGYIPKSVSADEMARAFSDVLEGRIYAPSVLAAKVEAPRAPSTAAAPRTNAELALTQRQSEVFEHLLHGKSTKEIARALNLAEGTVKIHLAVIYRVLGVHSRAEAIAKFKR